MPAERRFVSYLHVIFLTFCIYFLYYILVYDLKKKIGYHYDTICPNNDHDDTNSGTPIAKKNPLVTNMRVGWEMWVINKKPQTRTAQDSIKTLSIVDHFLELIVEPIVQASSNGFVFYESGPHMSNAWLHTKSLSFHFDHPEHHCTEMELNGHAPHISHVTNLMLSNRTLKSS